MPYIAYEDMPRPGDSQPVTSCPTCPEGWRPLDKDHCADCYEGKIERLHKALSELHALVWGECPSLLNEDSGGCARLDLEIRAALSSSEASK